MRALRFLASVVTTLAASGLLVSPAAGNSCVDRVIWNGTEYSGGGMTPGRVRHDGRLGEGEQPVCGEGGCVEPASTGVEVLRLAGISPEVAVGVLNGGSQFYLAPGYFPQLPSHPLHRAIYGPQPGRPDEKRGFSCGPRFLLKGKLASPAAWGALFLVEVDASEHDVGRYDEGGGVPIFVYSGTEFTGVERNGLPFVEEDDRIAIEARECLGGEARKLVAERLATG